MFRRDEVLTLRHIIRRNDKHRPSDDRRRVVTSVLAEYSGEDYSRYRKLFMAKGEPVVPESGTHGELNAMQKQYV